MIRTLPVLSPADFPDCLRPRAADSHKGVYGSLGLIGGAPGMGGALLLAARAAMHGGAGRVFASFLDPQAPGLDPLAPELMLRPIATLFDCPLTALAIGPGLGQSGEALRWLSMSLDTSLPLVLDADALNLLAAHPVLLGRLRKRTADAVLTPHPAEAARLLACTPEAVQEDRPAAARRLADITQAHVVLKGHGSLLAHPDHDQITLRINPTGNPGMASAGMGDVLTGLTGALLANGHATRQALGCAVYVHGQAADQCVARGTGPVGLTASEVAFQARAALNQLIQG